jgi:TP901-1 family phage major tail protein
VAYDGLAETGKSFLLKIGDGATPTETFTTLAGQKVTGLTVNGTPVDVSDKSNDWRVLLEGAALKSFTMNVSGVFKDTADIARFEQNAISQLLNNYQIIDQDGSIWEGAFLVTNYQKTGEIGGAVEFTATLESSGEITMDNVT